jgi:putative oxidoreductase
MSLAGSLLDSHAPRATILIRLMVGTVFVSEGLQKFLFPETLGAGRFAKIGISSPAMLAPLTGAFEIGCGALIILGLLTRLATLPLLAVIGTAIYKTKIPMFAAQGFWAMAHEARTDWSMLLALLFLLIVGAGRWSIDDALSAPRMTGIP